MQRAQVSRDAKLSALEVDEANAAAAREQGLVSGGEREVPDPVRHDQYLQQRKGGGHQGAPPPIRLDKQRLKQRHEARMILDEVDERDRVEGDGPGPKDIL